MARVLVTDAEQRSSLAAVRALGRAGHEVVACSADPRPLAGASRWCGACARVPDPLTDPGGFTSAVADLVRREEVQVALPMTDVSAPLVLSLRADHPDLVIPFPDLPDYQAISDKAGLMRVAAEVGVPVPRQVVLTSPGRGTPMWRPRSACPWCSSRRARRSRRAGGWASSASPS